MVKMAKKALPDERERKTKREKEREEGNEEEEEAGSHFNYLYIFFIDGFFVSEKLMKRFVSLNMNSQWRSNPIFKYQWIICQ